LKTYNAFNTYSDLGRNQVIVRPTSKPREALVDVPSIVAPSDESWYSTPTNYETTIRSRNYYQST